MTQGGSIMQILEHQSIYLNNVISYKISLPFEKIPMMLHHVVKNIDTLGLNPSGKLLFTEENNPAETIEILIPVQNEFQACAQYEKKEVFRLINAVTVRHEGDFSRIADTRQKLLDYIEAKSYQIITIPYYNVIRLNEEQLSDSIIDIYIGVNYNEL